MSMGFRFPFFSLFHVEKAGWGTGFMWEVRRLSN